MQFYKIYSIYLRTQDMSDGEYVKQLLLGFIHNICSSVTGIAFLYFLCFSALYFNFFVDVFKATINT